MRRCPKCQREYNDDTLRFCLEDGSSLTTITRDANPPPTAILPTHSQTQKSSALPTIPSYPNLNVTPSPSPSARQSNTVLTAGVVAIALLLLALVGIVAFYVIKQSGSNESAQVNSASTPAAKSTASVEKVTRDDRAEIASSSPANVAPLKITGSASSVRLAVQANTYYASNAIDGKRGSAWIEGVDGPGIGEWIQFDFDREINVHRILIQPGYFKSAAIWSQNNRLATVKAQFSDGSTRELKFDDIMQSQKIDVGSIKTRWVRLVIESVYYGSDPDTAISEIAFEWD